MSETPRLCPELDALLAAELAAGNRVRWAERATTRPEATLVMMESPFRAPVRPHEGVERLEVRDPHWWDVELRCAAHGHQLVCPAPTGGRP